MNIPAIAGVISTILAIYSAYPYISSVLKGKTKPDRLGWLVFTIMNGMVFFAQVFAGGRASTLISLAYFLFSLTVFVLSFSKGTHDVSNVNKVLFGFAVLGMIAWALTRNNDLAIWITLFVDLIASALIILKTRHHPNSENLSSWVIQTTAYVFSCISLYSVHFGILYVRPIYGLVCDAAIVGFIYYFKSTAAKKVPHLNS